MHRTLFPVLAFLCFTGIAYPQAVNGTLVGKASIVGSKLKFKLYDAQAPVVSSGDTIQLQTETGGIFASGVLV